MTVRIAHFTDIHVTARPGNLPWSAFLSKRLIGWVNLKCLGRYRKLEAATTITGAFVRDLGRNDADHVVFTGDVTSLSLLAEFEAARCILEPLLGNDAVTGIPGNHDVYVKSAVRQGLFERFCGRWVRTDLAREDFPESLRAVYPYPLLRLIGEEVALVFLRDVRPAALHDSSGRVGSLQLQALEHVLDLPEVRRRTRILALHYALRRADGSRDTFFHRLRDDERVLALAEEKSVHLVLHGHIHHRFVHPPGTVAGPAIANPGSLTYGGRERAYHIYTVNGPTISLEARRYDDALGEFRAWSDAPGSGQGALR